MSLYGSLWVLKILVDSNGSFRVLIVPYASLCVLMNPYVSLCLLNDSNRFLFVLIGSYSS